MRKKTRFYVTVLMKRTTRLEKRQLTALGVNLAVGFQRARESRDHGLGENVNAVGTRFPTFDKPHTCAAQQAFVD